MNVNAFCRADERWVCAACGKFTKAGGARSELRDSSCIMHAVRCHERATRWIAVGSDDELSFAERVQPRVPDAALVILQQESRRHHGYSDCACDAQTRAAALSLAERVLRGVE